MDKRIDAVKGIAILSVVAYHSVLVMPSTWPAWRYAGLHLPQNTPPISYLIPSIQSVKDVIDASISVVSGFGYQGVNLFLIASGLGLTLSFLRKGVKLPGWYGNRAKRILPMYWSSLAILFLLALYVQKVSPTSLVLPLVLQALGLHVFIPGFFQGFGLNSPVWFIGLLFQFYLVFPWLVKLFKRWDPLPIFICSVVVTVFFRLLGLYYINRFHSRFAEGVFFGCRLTEFVFGMCFAYQLRGGGQNWISTLSKFALPLYLSGILFHCFKFTSAASDTMMGVGLFLFLWNLVGCLPPVGLRAFAFPGRHSLGIFLFHFPFVLFMYELLRQTTIDNLYVRFFLVFVVCLVPGAMIDLCFPAIQRKALDCSKWAPRRFRQSLS
ncbi:acyltransferase [Candidatus Poribacteria bacterium]|nr:acyltransferase [Candidatus Poribacteria bacterium]